MKIIHDFPPNYDDIVAKIGIPPRSVVFTYGNIIYVPSGEQLDDALIAHEEIHKHQQGNDPAGWWERYFKDGDFRLRQEVEAYHQQFKVAKKMIKDGNAQLRFLHRIAADLSSDIYKLDITMRDAIHMIRSGRVE